MTAGEQLCLMYCDEIINSDLTLTPRGQAMKASGFDPLTGMPRSVRVDTSVSVSVSESEAEIPIEMDAPRSKTGPSEVAPPGAGEVTHGS